MSKESPKKEIKSSTLNKLNHSPLAGRVFLIMFLFLLVGSIALTFWRIVVKRDYIISAEQECDPYTEACFIYTCSPDEDEECPADPTERMSYYKLIHKNAQNIPLCNAQKDECPAELTCEENEEECEYIYCDEDTVAEGEECVDPVQYAIDNPPLEESTEENNSCTEELTTEEE